MKPRLKSAPLTAEDEGCWLMLHSEHPPGPITVAMMDAYAAADRRDAHIMLSAGMAKHCVCLLTRGPVGLDLILLRGAPVVAVQGRRAMT